MAVVIFCLSLMKGYRNYEISKNDTLDAICPAHIKEVLDAAYFAHPLPPTPLQQTDLFFSYVRDKTDFDSAQSKTLNDFLLLELLSDQIHNRLTEHRKLFNLSAPSRYASYEDTIKELQCDFQQNAVELEAWSVLYFRYMRVELQFGWLRFEAITFQDERTLRRRQERGILRLVYTLIEQEMAIRNSQHTIYSASVTYG